MGSASPSPTLIERFKDISFQAKVLVPVVALLVALPVITFWIVDQHFARLAQQEARQTLSTAGAVFRNSLDIRERSLRTRFRDLVNEPRFKAVSQLNDADTMRAFLRDTLQELGDEVDLALYTPLDGSPEVGTRRNAKIDLAAFSKTVADSIETALSGDLQAGLALLDEQPYHAISIPVFLSNPMLPAGALTVGVRFGDAAIKDLESLTNTRVLLIVGERIVAGAAPREGAQALFKSASALNGARESDVLPTLIDGQHFHYLTGALDNIETSGPGLSYALLSSYEEPLKSLRDTRFALLSVSAIGISASILVIWFLIQRITRPLRELRDGAEAVGRGDYSRRVTCDSRDECGELADAFNHMTDNIQLSHAALEETVGELRDTQKKLLQREIRLRESEEGLRLIVEGSRDHAIFTIDSQGRAVRWTSSAQRLLGYDAAAAQGLPYERFFAQEDRATAQHAIAIETAAREGRASFEGWRVRADGSRFWADVTLSRLGDSNRDRNGGFVEITRDITTRKEAEEAMRAARDAAEASDRAKSEFLANMSHEIRTPMNGIIGNTSLLLDHPLNDEQKDCAETIRFSAESLLSIIDDILDISNSEAGRMELEAQPTPITELLEDTVNLYTAPCREKGLELRLVISRDLPGIVQIDSSRFRQALSNLLSNALKFTDQGSIRVHAGRDPQSGQIRISVQDTGIGMPADKTDKLFTPFYQIESNFSRAYGGTGLGLAIARNIVELLNGKIGFESKPGSGSTFFFTVEAPALPGDSPLLSVTDKRILVLADDPKLREDLFAQFSAWQASTQCERSTPGPLLRALEGASFDLIVCDESAARPDTLKALANWAEQTEAPLPTLLHLRKTDLPESPVWPSATATTTRYPFPSKLNRVVIGLLYPAGISKAAKATTPKTSPSASEPSETPFAETHPLKILVVEDNPVNAKLLVRILNKLGYEPTTAENGALGLEAAEEGDCNFIFMDLQMPVMNGFDSARRILESDTINRAIYISAFTANARQEDRDACQAAGMHNFVAKPARMKELAEVLAKAHTDLSRSSSSN